jgi:STE24 endopeptidase
MLHPFILLAFGLLVAESPPIWDPIPWFTDDPLQIALAVTASSLLYGMAGYLPVLITRHELRRSPERTEALVIRQIRMTSGYRLMLVLLFTFQLHGLGWQETVLRGLDGKSASYPPLLTGCLLFPFLLGWAASWIPYARLEGSFGRCPPAWHANKPGYYAFQTRQLLTPLLLFGVILSLTDLISRLTITPPDAPLPPFYPMLLWAPTAACIGLAYLLSPILFRTIWPTHPIPPGPIRERRHRLAERTGFPPGRILAWSTHGRMINACTIGLAGPLRYILLSDALLESLAPEESEAVLAHELGHVGERHFGFYFLYSVTLMALVLLLELRGGSAGAVLLSHPLSGLLLLGLFWSILGYGSRRLEKQADGYAALLLGDPRRVQDALIKISILGGQPHRLKTLTHGSILSRLDFLQDMKTGPENRSRLDRSIRRMKAGLVLALTAGLIGLAIP